jgi:hypothetical protein
MDLRKEPGNVRKACMGVCGFCLMGVFRLPGGRDMLSVLSEGVSPGRWALEICRAVPHEN